MDWVFPLLFGLGITVFLPLWLIVRAIKAGRRIEELSLRVLELEADVSRLKKIRPAPGSKPETSASPISRPAHIPPAAVMETPFMGGAAPPPLSPAMATAVREAASTVPIEPPVLDSLVPSIPKTLISPDPIASVASSSAPSVPRAPAVPDAPPSLPIPVPAINWEQFMGVKMFAWLGGLALFLGVAFFVKYSFERNLIPPELRVAIGFAAGIGLLVGGVVMSRKDYAVLSQTLCATGVVVLYAVTFACRSIYRFEFFGPVPAFLLMVLITTTAFFLAVRLDARVVAILGILGGFLTPILVGGGVDRPFSLFSYIALLDIGLMGVALNRRWHFLMMLGAMGTAFIQIGWASRFFVSEKYFEGNKVLIAMAALLGFNVLYLAAAGIARRREQTNRSLTGGKLGLAVLALGFAAWFLSFGPLAERPWLVFGFVFLIDISIAALTLLDKSVTFAQPLAGLAVFGLLAFWTEDSLNARLLNPALVFYMIFAVIHAAFPVFLMKRRGIETTLWASRIFPLVPLMLVLVPMFNLAELSILVWPFVLLVDLLTIGLAIVTLSLVPVFAVMILTLAAAAAMIFRIPATLTGLPTSLFIIGGFAIFFVASSVWAARRLKINMPGATGINLTGSLNSPENIGALLPVFSSALPFLLLIMAAVRLPLINPSPLFGLALLLIVLLLGLAKMCSFDSLSIVALICIAALEWVWHSLHFMPDNALRVLSWYLIFHGVLTLFPFVFTKSFINKTVPWAASALAGVPQFFLIHRLVGAAYPNQVMGLLPAAFAIPPLIGLVIILKKCPASAPRLTQLAFFGGAALFFITLIFPIQFDRQWITLGWGLEGAALLWLFHRVPHPGLRLTGVGLSVIAFVRLALNPAVLGYHPRSTTPVFNWYLYTYGTVTFCLFAGARLLAPPRDRVWKINGPPFLSGLGTVLAFLLLNIEIADYFSEPGSTLTFQFSGHFGRDMTYSIAWALFALTLLVVGIMKKIPASRYAALGLLSATLIKLFFHDLAQLGQLYLVGAFIGVAVIAMLASFAYQRFYAMGSKEKGEKK